MNARAPTSTRSPPFTTLNYPSADDPAFRERFLQTAPILRPLGLDGGECVVFAAAAGDRYRHRVAGLDGYVSGVVAKALGRYNAFGFAADIHNYVVVVHGDNGSLQSLTGRVVRGVFALLLFELGEDIAKRRFFLGRGLVLEGVCDLFGLLLHENREGFVLFWHTSEGGRPVTHYHGSGALHIPSPLAAAAGFRVAVAVLRAGAGKHRSDTSGDRSCLQP